MTPYIDDKGPLQRTFEQIAKDFHMLEDGTCTDRPCLLRLACAFEAYRDLFNNKSAFRYDACRRYFDVNPMDIQRLIDVGHWEKVQSIIEPAFTNIIREARAEWRQTFPRYQPDMQNPWNDAVPSAVFSTVRKDLLCQ